MNTEKKNTSKIIGYLKKLVNGKKLAVWGCGKDGHDAAGFLSGSCVEPDIFIDSNPALTGRKILDRYPIYSPDTVINDENYFIIVATRSHNTEIVATLSVSGNRKAGRDYYVIQGVFCVENRKDLWNYLDPSGPILEIGPCTSPFIKRENGFNVYYADINNTDGIFENYLNKGDKPGIGEYYSPIEMYEKLVPIDFVVADGYKHVVGDIKFSAIFSSHVIEHTTDIITHLLDLGECIHDGGYVVLVIPDKRYNLTDYFREVTPFRDALDVYLGGIKNMAKLDFDSIFSSFYAFRFRDSWNPDIEGVPVSFADRAIDMQSYKKALDAYYASQNGSPCFDHHWVFTYSSFLAFFRDGLRAGLFPYRLEYSSQQASRRFEFCIALQKDSGMLTDQQCRKDEILRVQRMIDEIEGLPVCRGYNILTKGEI